MYFFGFEKLQTTRQLRNMDSLIRIISDPNFIHIIFEIYSDHGLYVNVISKN